MSRRLSAIIVLFLCAPAVVAKKRKQSSQNSNHIHGRKRECESECALTDEDERPNCVLRCQSETCYADVYLPEELEPGEIDLARQRSFGNCLTNEQRTANRRTRQKAAPEPAQPADNTVAPAADEAAESLASTEL